MTLTEAQNACRAQGLTPLIQQPMTGAMIPNPMFDACVQSKTGYTQQQQGGQWKDPQNIASTAEAVVSIASLFQKTPERQEVIAVCGRRPVFGAEKKAAYNLCAQNVMNASLGAGAGKQTYYPQQEQGMSTGAKIGIAVGVLVFIVLIILIIVMMRKKS